MILDYIRCIKCERPVSPIKFDFREVAIAHVRCCMACKYDDDSYIFNQPKQMKVQVISKKSPKKKWSKKIKS